MTHGLEQAVIALGDGYKVTDFGAQGGTLTEDADAVRATTLVDSDLTAELTVGVWFVQFYPVISTDGDGDIKVNFDFDGTATGKVLDIGSGFTTEDFGTAIDLAGSDRADFASYETQIVAVVTVTEAGTLTVQYAQRATDAAHDTFLAEGSVLQCTKVN